MPRKKKEKEKEILRNILVEKVGAEGNAIARTDGKVIFVRHAVPGDIVDIQPVKIRERYIEGYIVNLIKPSPDRVEPFCAHYKECGGCTWQELPYNLQLEYKQQQVVEQFRHIGHIDLTGVEILPIIPSEKITGYRNKLEFSFSDRRWLYEGENPEEVFDPPTPLNPADFKNGIFPPHLRKGYSLVNSNPVGFALGFHRFEAFDKILDIEKCYLQPSPSNEIRNFIKKYAIEHKLPFFNIREQTGFLRNIIVRTNLKGEAMLTIMFGAHPPVLGRLKTDFNPASCDKEAEALFDTLLEKFPQIRSMNYLYNGRLNDAINDQEIINYKSDDAIYEEMEGLRFKIGPKSFYQTNPLQAYKLYSVVRDFARLEGNEKVFDLYTGTGTIALFLARNVKSVVGIEYVPEAIEDAKTNMEINGIRNCTFHAGDMKDLLTPEFIEENGGRPDVIICDPPRAGIHPDVVRVLLDTASQRIIYVSCNPATQARDVAMLSEKYRIRKICPVDMFPHTHHVENVVLLEL